MNDMTQPQRKMELQLILQKLAQQGRITSEESDRVFKLPRGKEDREKHPLVYLASLRLEDQQRSGKVLDEEALTRWCAEDVDMPFYHIDPLKVKAGEVTEVMSFAYAKMHKVLCVGVGIDSVTIACSEPFLTTWVENLEHVLKKRVDRVFAYPADIEKYTTEFYSLAKSVSGASGNYNFGNNQNLEAMMQLGEMNENVEANDKHIVSVVDWLLQYAFEQRASDIHIEPRREEGYVRFRIDGVLHRVYEMPVQVLTAIVSRIKGMGRMNIAEKRKPQDGRLKTLTPEGLEVELRLATLPTAFGEKMVLRVFDPEVLVKSFSQLGLSNQEHDRWQAMASRPDGIILVTGPTGSGKTTTLYTTLKQLATDDVNVCTIEDPIEMVVDEFNQMQVQHSIDLDFAAGVRALLRQDPDIIMVGEIRDKETAEMAIQASLTGHLVISTLHTNDAASALTRLMEIGIPYYLINATLIGVMAQRLVRTLCEHCKEEDEVDLDQWTNLVSPWKIDPPEKMFKPVGCLECRNTGYKGRMGIYEIMPVSYAIQKLLAKGGNLADIQKTGIKEGMKTLRLSGAQKVINGYTTIEEVLRVAPSSHLE